MTTTTSSPASPPLGASWIGLSPTQHHCKRIQRGIPTPDSWPYLEHRVRQLVSSRFPAASLLPPDTDLDDLVQTVLFHVLVNISKFAVTPEASFGGWVCWIARRRATSLWRRHLARGGRRNVSLDDVVERQAIDEPVGEAVSPETIAYLREREQQMRAAVAALSATDQQVLELREEQGLPFAEIATELGFRRPVTARCRYHRAVHRRRQVLREVYGR